MKRSNDFSFSYGAKVRKSDSGTVLRILMPCDAAGPIIGKGGEHIKRIRNEFSVRLRIPHSRGPERIFYLEGEITSISACLKAMTPQLLDVLSAVNANSRLLNSKNPDIEDFEDKELDPKKLLDIRILVHQSQVGSLIGKHGERIKELQRDNRINIIKIYHELAPGSTDRVVQVIGKPDNVYDCLEGIMETLESSDLRGPIVNYEANVCDVEDVPVTPIMDPYAMPEYGYPSYPDYTPGNFGYEQGPMMYYPEEEYDLRSYSRIYR